MKCLDAYTDRFDIKCNICKHEYKTENIYFAGKIYYDRSNPYPRIKSIFADGCYESFSDDIASKLLDEHKNTVMKESKYNITGPYVFGCDHGCFHNTTLSHGVQGSKIIVDNCLNQIQNSDIVIANIDRSITCYGTLMEIGYALSLNKPVYIVFEDFKNPENQTFCNNINDLWFIINACKNSLSNGDQKYRNIRCYTVLNELKTKRGNDSLGFINEDEYLTSLELES